ncbi:MAG: DMT family transporter [Treponemataceae bacterium]
MTERRSALIAIIFAVVFWGFSFISIKIAVVVLPPMSLGAVRFVLAVVFLWFVKRKTSPKERLETRDLPHLIGAGLAGVTSYFFFENNGVLLVSASEASVIIGTIPVISMVAERAVFGGRIAKRRWMGAALSVIGVWLVAGAAIAVSGEGTGYLFMTGAAASWVLYCFLTRPLFARRSRIYIVFWQSVFGLIGFLPFVFRELPRWGRIDLSIALHVAYLGIFCSALGYWFYARALETLGVGAATVFVNLIPVITVVAGYFILGDRLTFLQWAGSAAVLLGVSLATWEGRAPHQVKENKKPNA